MTREETKKVLKVLSTAYPKHFANMSKADKLDQIDLYESMFAEYPAEIVVAALKAYIKNNEYPPSIAGLQKQIDLILPSREEDSIELWNVLAKVCKRGSRVTKEEFSELPETIRAWCGDVAQIKELSQMDAATFNTVTRGQFLKTVPTIVERKKACEALPESIRRQIKNETEKRLLERLQGGF